jgi:PAS domain S-box-containing protein
MPSAASGADAVHPALGRLLRLAQHSLAAKGIGLFSTGAADDWHSVVTHPADATLPPTQALAEAERTQDASQLAAWRDTVAAGPRIGFALPLPLPAAEAPVVLACWGPADAAPIDDMARWQDWAASLARELPTAHTQPPHPAGGLAQLTISVMRQMASGAPLPTVLTELIEQFEALVPGLHGSVLLLKPDGKTLRHVAAPRLANSFCEAIDGSLIGEGQGSCGTAAHRGTPVIVEDIRTSPLWADYRDIAMRHDLAACWSYPIKRTTGEVLGTLAMYYRQPRRPSADELRLASTVAHLAGLAIERVQLEEALAAHSDRLELTIDAANLGIWDWKVGHDVSYNDRFMGMLGYAPGEVPYSLDAWLDLVHADDRAAVRAALKPYLEGENTDGYAVTFRARHRDGHYVWLHDTGRVVETDGEGRPQRAIGIRQDITAEQESANLMQRLGHIMDRSAEEIYLIDVETLQFAFINTGARQNLGYTPEELATMTPADIKPLGVRELRDLSAPLHQDEDVVVFETYHRRKDGTEYPVEIHLYLIEGGRPPLYTAFVTDLTEQRQHEQTLIDARHRAEQARYNAELARAREEELHQLKTSFLANMSHEIRTPLTAIIGFADVLTEETEGHAQECAETIRRSSERLRETLTSVLDLAQLESESFTLRPSRVDVTTTVEDTARMFAPLAERKGLTLDTEGPSQPLYAHLDGAALGRILTNLVSNAVKFTDEGQITLQVASTETHVQLDVQDTGVGISTDFLPQLFDDFKQESRGFTRAYEGNGLGLAITHKLVSLMNGTITADSTKGVGSTFTVRLPLRPASAMTDSPTAQPTLLLVEDSPEAQQLIDIILADAFAVDITDNVEDALAMAEATTYDVCLIDVHLRGDRGGAEFVQVLNDTPAYAEVPKIAWTAFALPGDEERLLAEGFTHYLSKPTRRADLLGLLDEVMDLDA